MVVHETIIERFEQRAASAEPDVAAALTAAAKKIASFSRAPGKRKDADRMAAVLSPDVVVALGEAFLDVRREEIDDPPHPLFGCEFREADYAFAALLVAAGDPALAPSAQEPLERVTALVARMEPKQAEHIQYLAGLYPEVAAAGPLREAAGARLGQEPETPSARWARELGLDLPAEFWSVYFLVPGAVSEGRADVSIAANWSNQPGDGDTVWSIRLGVMNANSLGGNRSVSGPDSPHGVYDRQDRDAAITGAIAPATGPEDLPRVLADLERAHPELSYDRQASKISGTPGRLITPKKKKVLIDWLSSAT